MDGRRSPKDPRVPTKFHLASRDRGKSRKGESVRNTPPSRGTQGITHPRAAFTRGNNLAVLVGWLRGSKRFIGAVSPEARSRRTCAPPPGDEDASLRLDSTRFRGGASALRQVRVAGCPITAQTFVYCVYKVDRGRTPAWHSSTRSSRPCATRCPLRPPPPQLLCVSFSSSRARAHVRGLQIGRAHV